MGLLTGLRCDPCQQVFLLCPITVSCLQLCCEYPTCFGLGLGIIRNVIGLQGTILASLLLAMQQKGVDLQVHCRYSLMHAL